MANFRVNSQTLRCKAEQLRAMNDQFKNKVAQLTQSENSLHGMWEGEAHSAFHTAYNNDVQQFEKFCQGIMKYVEALKSAAQEYERAEQRNIEIAKQRKA